MADGLAKELFMAVKLGLTKEVDGLLSLGAATTFTDDDGRSCLHWAMHDGNDSIIRLLLKAGATIEVEDKYGRTPFDFVRVYYPERYDRCRAIYVEYEQEKKAQEQQNKAKPWFQAIHESDAVTINEFLTGSDRDFYRNVQNAEGENALHVLASQQVTEQNAEIFNLLKKSPDVEKGFATQNHQGKTPLHLAAQAEHWHWVLEAVTQLHSTPKGDPYQYQSALYYAVSKNAPIEVVSLLVSNSAPITAISAKQESLLHLAILNKNLPVQRLLLLSGINPATLNQDGHNAIDLTVSSQYLEAFNAFSERNKARALAKAAAKGREIDVAFILSSDLPKTKDNLHAALIAAANGKHLLVLKAILACVDATHFPAIEASNEHDSRKLEGQLLYTLIIHPAMPKRAIQSLAKQGKNKEIVFAYIKTLNEVSQRDILEKVLAPKPNAFGEQNPLATFFNEPRKWFSVSSWRGVQKQLHLHLKKLSAIPPVAASAALGATSPVSTTIIPDEGTRVEGLRQPADVLHEAKRDL